MSGIFSAWVINIQRHGPPPGLSFWLLPHDWFAPELVTQCVYSWSRPGLNNDPQPASDYVSAKQVLLDFIGEKNSGLLRHSAEIFSSFARVCACVCAWRGGLPGFKSTKSTACNVAKENYETFYVH